MKTKTYNVYTFAELTGPARQKAIKDHAEFIGERFDGWATIEDAKQCLAFAGFSVDEVHYSGFSCQGDGACFSGSWRAADVAPTKMREHAPQDAELHRIADALAVIAAQYPQASLTVKQSGSYSHEYCTDFSVQLFEDEGIDWPAGAAEIEKLLIELSRDSMRWIYRQLEADYTWQTAEPQVIESIEANEYEFTADGAID